MAVNLGLAIALPCNEYFHDLCINDQRSALGAYVCQFFAGQLDQFEAAVLKECRAKLGDGIKTKKTDQEFAISYGPGRSVVLPTPLNKSIPIALVSTTTQRAGEGLSGRISYLFSGMKELFERLADFRINEIVMPVFGSGHGGLSPKLAFVGLMLALAEAAKYGQGGQRLKRVVIVVFKKDAASVAQIEDRFVRRVLGLIAGGS